MKGFSLHFFAALLILYEVFKREDSTNSINILAIRYISWLALLTKTILYIPFIHAFLAFTDRSVYLISESLFTPYAIISSLGLLFLLINTYIFILFIR